MRCALVYSKPKTGNVCPFNKQTQKQVTSTQSVSLCPLSLAGGCNGGWRMGQQLKWDWDYYRCLDLNSLWALGYINRQHLGSWLDTLAVYEI
jgi:hypothetical protein